MLFSLYVPGYKRSFLESCDIGMFADGIALWCSGPDVNHIESTLTTTLTEVWNFANDYQLIFNVSKSYVSFFTTNKHLFSYQPPRRSFCLKTKKNWGFPGVPGDSLL
ncbi:hypothetical protein TNIN_181961 [Trichonephila inaurata madagascariensis]|uniref:Reverse transcriptase domain-containing protein n=1 Tax=Trichonephila inaurata madagascariensis TaxID=2747483 RepID=A0A8X7CCW9_9ARAC|nr:hypothetical protein TNIN_181961 [Trichonephila inaurata madagascariensis]